MKGMTIMDAGEIWYQRSHKLSDYFKNPENPESKRLKAFVLTQILINRLVAVSNAEMKRMQPKYISFNRGGVSFIPK